MSLTFNAVKTQTEDVTKGFKTGGNDYVRKPFSMEELIVRIENLLFIKQVTEPSAQTADVIKLDKYLFFINRQVLLIDSDERKLSFRESELLKHLWLH